MLGFIRQAKIRTMGNGLAGLLVLVSVLVAGVTTFQHRKVAKIEGTWSETFRQPNLKSAFLTEIHANLGYGGLIDNFKNFVLREDKRLAITFYSKLMQITFSLDALEGLETSELERAAIIQLRDIVEQYAAMAKVAETLMAAGATAREINTATRIDDSSAIQAIIVLNSELERFNRAGTDKVLGTIKAATQYTILTSIAVAVLLFGLCIVIFWTFRVRLFGPLDSLRETMHLLAQGNYTIEIPGREEPDELGDMARALEIFRRNTAEVEDLRQTQALAESRAQEAELQAAAEKHHRIVAPGKNQARNRGNPARRTHRGS